MSIGRRATRFGALACVVALAAGACGSDGGDEEAAPTTAKGTATTAAAGAGPDDPSTWGVKDKKLTGPAGFSVDLSKCPAKWDDKTGLTDTEIRIGASMAQSGSFAVYGPISQGMKAYFDHINTTEGGIAGRKINFNLKDDGYEAARGKANVDELLETGNLFAFSGTLGTPIVMATNDKVNEACVPNISVSTAHPAWGDPVNRPWTTATTQLNYSSEALLWGDYILKKYGKGVTVAALAINSEFGAAYRVTFEKWAKDNGVTLKTELHDPAAPSITNEMTTLAATNADVIILMTASGYCTQAVKYMEESTWKPKERLISNTCASVSFFKPAGFGAGNGWVSISDRRDPADPTDQKEEIIKLTRDLATKNGVDPNLGAWAAGVAQMGWHTVDVLKDAAKLNGGLTRTNLMIASRNISKTHPFYRPGIKYEMKGNLDAFPSEGGVTVKYTVEAGKETGVNVPFGEVLDLNGKTPNCAWDGKQCK
ncbi:MAG: ABC transporter substrate-binding protein [Acidimicrobiales bacterium]